MPLSPLSEPVALLPGELLRIERVVRDGRHDPPPRFLHMHVPAEVVVFDHGEGQFHCDGWSAAFAPGTAVFVPSLAAHDYRFAEGPLGWTLLQFDPLIIRTLPLAWPAGAAVFRLDDGQRDRAATLLAWLREGIAARPAPAALELRLQALLAALAEGKVTMADRGPAPLLGRLRPLLERLHATPDEAPQLAAAAAGCAMSTGYFARQFRAMVGTSFADYVELLRLQSAARWLATGADPIATIADRAGYRSHAHFSARFRARFGCTPAEHRRRSRRLA